MPTPASLLCHIEHQIATLTLNAPERHNALNQQDLLAIEQHFLQFAGDSNVRVVVITGSGEKTFCAGASLNDVRDGLKEGNRFQQMTSLIENFPKPTISSLNGSVYGGGVELALACDFRIGITGMKMFVPPAKLGLCYPYAGLQRFVSRLGLSTAKRLLLANDTFSAEEAKALGFLDYLVAPEARAAQTQALASKLAQLAPLSLQAMKQTLNELARGEGDHDAASAREALCLHSDDLQEGLRAQQEKRPPVFQGK